MPAKRMKVGQRSGSLHQAEPSTKQSLAARLLRPVHQGENSTAIEKNTLPTKNFYFTFIYSIFTYIYFEPVGMTGRDIFLVDYLTIPEVYIPRSLSSVVILASLRFQKRKFKM